MCLVVPIEGEKRLLDMAVDGDSFTDVRLGVYKNDYTPVSGSVFADFTAANFSGYAVATPSFSAATTVNGRGEIIDSAARDFTHNGGGTSNTCYGYYVYDNANSKILWAERFGSALLMAVSGDKIRITLHLAMGSAN